jgi:hypothetical protein
MAGIAESKTELPCDCGLLGRAARNPQLPVEFDAELNEFNIVHAYGKLRIHHCFFCGGRLPESVGDDEQ